MTIRGELEELKAAQDFIKPEAVVDWAREHPDSALHKSLEWNDEKAAAEYRIWQVRRLIAIHVLDEAGERKFVSLSIDRVKGGGYRDIEDIAADPVLADAMLADALDELRRARKKYSRVKALNGVWSEVDRAERDFGPAVEAVRASA